jgi:ABC-type glycerol-3-phosphate transport system permease component
MTDPSKNLVRKLKESLEGYLFILPSVVIVGVFGLFPVFFTLSVSFHKWSIKQGKFLGLENFLEAFATSTYLLFIGYYALIFANGLANIPRQLYEAAEVDGASKLNTFFRITVPLLSPTTFFLMLLGFIGTFKAFNHIYVLRHPSVRGAADPMSVYIFFIFFRKSRFGYAETVTRAAYAFAKLYFVGKNIIFSLLLATLMIPETVLLIPNFIIVSSLKWVNKLPALTVPFIAGAFHIFLLRQFFNQIPNALVESARLDGCSHLRILLSIVVPLSRAPLFTVGFLAFLHSWNALQWPLVVIRTPRWRPISVVLVMFITEAGPETQLRLVGAVIALVSIVIVYTIAQKQITEAITRTGLKELGRERVCAARLA